MSDFAVGKYQAVSEPLDHDTLGILYAAQDTTDGSLVYLKRMRFKTPRSTVRGGQAASSDAASTLSALSIEGLTTVQDEISLDGEQWRVSRRPAGELLINYLSRHRTHLPQLRSGGIWGRHQLLCALTDVSLALEAMHQANLVHGAVHAAAITIELGSPAVGDLLCFEQFTPRPSWSYLEDTNQIQFLAQEQLRGGGDPASDIYALGVLLFACFGEDLPFAGNSVYEIAEKIVWGNFTPFTPFLDDLSPGLIVAIRPDLETLGMIATRALQRDPAARFGSVGEIATLLKNMSHRLDPAVLARNLQREGDLPLAIEVLNEAVSKPGASADVNALLGVLYGFDSEQTSDHYEQAALAFKRALGIEPENASIRLQLAEFYTRYQRYKLAEREFATVMNAGQRDLTVMMGYAAVLERSGDMVSALNVLRVLQRQAPYVLPIYIQAIRTGLAFDNRKEAEIDCRTALERIAEVISRGNLPPAQVAEIYHLYGRVHYQAERYDNAIRWLNKALEMVSNHLPSHNLLAMIYGTRGETQLALQHFLTSLYLNPDQPTLAELVERFFSSGNASADENQAPSNGQDRANDQGIET